MRLPLGMEEGDLRNYIEARAGMPFSREVVDTDVMRLMLTGKFRDIQAQVEEVSLPTGEKGVKVIYTFVPKTIIKEIIMEGNRALSRDALLTAMVLREGAEFRRAGAPKTPGAPSPALKEDLDRWTQAVKDAYRKEGYPQSEVSFKAEDVEGGVRIIISVSENYPVLASDIRFMEDVYYDEDALKGTIPLKVGHIVKEFLLEESVRSLKEFYRKNGFWGATIGRPAVTRLESGMDVRVVFSVKAGDKYGISFSGASHVKAKKLMKSIDLEGGIAVDYWAEQMERAYREDGFLFAKITPVVSPGRGPREKDIYFIVAEGPRIRLMGISFRGNAGISSNALLAHMATRPWTLKGWLSDLISGENTNGIYTEERFRKDIQAIHSLYQSRGFLEVRIEDVRPDINRDNGTMNVAVDVTEGPVTTLDAVEFEGVHSLPTGILLTTLHMKQGAPLDLMAVEMGKRGIVAKYRKEGFFFAAAEAHVDLDKKAGKARVIYAVREGRRLLVGRIIIQGTDKTRDYVIVREVTFKTGDPYTQEGLLESQRRLTRLGYFNRVSLTPIDRDTVRDILIKVQEGNTAQASVGVGYGNVDGLRGFIEVSENNITGRGRAATIRLDGAHDVIRYVEGRDSLSGSWNEGRVTLGYREPYLFRTKVHGRADLIPFEYQNRRYVDFAIQKSSGILGIDYSFTESLKGDLLYEFEIRRLSGRPLGAGEPGLLQLAVLSPIVFYDIRNDPFNPRRGQILSLQTDWAETLFGSKESFVKVTGKWGYFNPVFDNIIGSLVARVGYAFPYRQSTALPLERRFFTGGANSIRGFVEDSVGPVTTTTVNNVTSSFPAGGNILLNVTLESRVPLWGSLGLALFTDWGNVWEGPDRFALGSFADVRKSAGFGLRYKTPIGPLRADLGFKLDRRGTEPVAGFHFFIGNVF